MCTFLDNEGVFGNISYDTIVKVARGREVDHTVCRWIDSMLCSRQVHTSLGQEVLEIDATRGCPQKGITFTSTVGPGGLLRDLNGVRAYVQGYPDVMIVQCMFHSTLEDLNNYYLILTSDWFLREVLRVNPSKTVIIPYSRKKAVGKGNV